MTQVPVMVDAHPAPVMVEAEEVVDEVNPTFIRKRPRLQRFMAELIPNRDRRMPVLIAFERHKWMPILPHEVVAFITEIVA